MLNRSLPDEGAPGWFLARLRGDLEQRLKTLEDEARCIKQALAALDPPRAIAHPRRALRDDLVDAVREHPDARPSVLAYALGASVREVVAVLESLRDEGVLAQVGRRWRLAERPPHVPLTV
jgi:hypothetical protein